jgi:hypothetical protein
MFKSTTVIMTAAFIAAAVTLLSVPASPVGASPVAASVNTAMTNCAQRPWPYLRCVGTEFGNWHIRLVTTDRLNTGF